MSARPRDIDTFLSGYPNTPDVPTATANLEFYSNRLAMEPDGLKYEEFLRKYDRDFEELEENHGYIQWLFPIRENGVNDLAQPLETHEARSMASDPVILARLLRSYTMMLSFYGIEFNSGRLQPTSASPERFENLKYRPHNLLRLTRILKHLSEIPPLQPYAAPLVLFFVSQHSEGNIDFGQGTMHGDSMDRWWSNCFRDEREREEVREIVMARGGCMERKWGKEDFERWYDRRGKQGWADED